MRHQISLFSTCILLAGTLLLGGCTLPSMDGISVDSFTDSTMEGVKIEGITIEGLQINDLSIDRLTIDQVSMDRIVPSATSGIKADMAASQEITPSALSADSQAAAPPADMMANNTDVVAALPGPASEGIMGPSATAATEPAAATPAGAETTAPQVGQTGERAYTGPATLMFSDQTEAAGVNFTHATPIVDGDGAKMISGGAAGDFNNDGWTDLYVVGGGLNPDALFINQQDGTFVDMAEAAGLGELHLGSGAAVGDYNNDGWQDIYVTSFGTPDNMGPGFHRLYRNNGDGTFTDVAKAAGVNLTSPELPDGLGATFGDYDLDGDLDLFVAGWRKPEGEPALGNRLFRNNGDGTFDDVTGAAGIVDDGIRGFSPTFVDMDGDRYPELLLSADFGTSRYFHNNTDGTFSDMTQAAGTNLTWSGMGSAVGDINNDGLPDWFITAIFDADSEGRGLGNGLYINQGDNRYREEAIARLVADGGWGWGTDIMDFNNDGLLDIVAVNGWQGIPAYEAERGKLWLQSPNGTFEEVAKDLNFGTEENQLGLLTLDYDNDGDRDVVVTAYNGELRLYRNDLTGASTNWLRVVLDSSDRTDLAPDGMGSKLAVVAGDNTYTRFQSGGTHYLTQSELSLHVGLGVAEIIDSITVTWPDGSTTVLNDVAVNQTLTVKPDQR